MFFPKQTIVIGVSKEPKGANSVDITVNIAEGDVPDETVIASSIAGNSPRVRVQGQLRREGWDSTRTLNMSALEWFGSPRAQRNVQLTPEQIDAEVSKRAQNDAEYRKAKIAELLAMEAEIEKRS